MATKGLFLGTVFNPPPPGPVLPTLPVTANLALWLDAADASSVISTGDKVDQWNDKSGAGLVGNFTPVNANRPDYGLIGDRINGWNTVTFPADFAQSLVSSLSGDIKGGSGYTYFFVLEPDVVVYTFTGTKTYYITTKTTPTISGYHTYIPYTSTSTYPAEGWLLWKGGTKFEFAMETRSHWVSTGDGTPASQNMVHNDDIVPIIQTGIAGVGGDTNDTIAYTDGGFTHSRTDWAPLDDPPTNSAKKYFLGARMNEAQDTLSEDFTGSIAEILVYNSVLSGGDVTLVNNYLADKWGITLA